MRLLTTSRQLGGAVFPLLRQIRNSEVLPLRSSNVHQPRMIVALSVAKVTPAVSSQP